MTKKIAVLTSGMSRGSNFEAIVHYIRDYKLPIEVVFVIVTRENAPIIEKCKSYGIPYILQKMTDMNLFELSLLDHIIGKDVNLIVLSGFLFKLSPQCLRALPCPVINIHPALLPQYGGPGMYGHHVHEAVFASGDIISGATVHWVNEDYDAGKIIAQQTVDLTSCKSPEDIAATVIQVEHQLYGPTIWHVLENNLKP
jgi:phosphoribosylglycinamide formyltransferase 1